ncbi:type II secretion system GspH family protein [Clostridiaceae bacterium OttesenSCG-928-D20]|nr:type II secretion system GspH family protein [Clostridiaceae bacterium OttesenSCG-928-D20]
MKFVNFTKKVKQKLAFTLTEMIVVVAIIAILTGVAAASYTAVKKDLEVMKADAAAKSIFVSAQSRMSELRTSGIIGDGEGYIDKLGGSHIVSEPSDFSVEADYDWDEEAYFYLSSDINKTSVARLLTTGSVEASIFEGHYYIEYNAKTGMIYGVFFSEKPFGHPGDFEGSSNGMRLDKKVRKENDPVIGYYGGSTIALGDNEWLETPEFELINSDDLYVTFEYNSDLIYDLTIIDEFENSYTYENIHDKANSLKNITLKDGVYTIILDRLLAKASDTVDMRFSQLPHGKDGELQPGSDIKVVLTVRKENAVPASAMKTDNSLYAKKTENEEGTENEALIDNPRHLQNLDITYAGLDGVLITSAKQGGAIEWKRDDYNFVSINNDKLQAYSGEGNFIADLNNSLFDSYKGKSKAETASVINLTLTDPQVKNSDKANLGTLINTAEFVKVSGCKIISSEVSNSASATLESTYTNIENTGGLIGYAKDCEISMSSASLNLIKAAKGNIGGLVGKSEGSKFEKSYADTGWWIKEDSAKNIKGEWKANTGIVGSGAMGGFAGTANSGSVFSNCFAVGNIENSSGTAAGFSTGQGSHSLSYSAVTFERTADTGVTVHGFSPSASQTDCKFLAVPKTAGGLDSKALTKFFDGETNWARAHSSTSIPYGRQNEVYPFPILVGHRTYGDWPDAELGGTLVYYEKYLKTGATDNGNAANYEYGVYINTADEKYNNLSDTKTIKHDGYGLLVGKNSSEDKTTEPSFECKNGADLTTLELLKVDDKAVFYEVKIGDKFYDLYPFKLVNAEKPTVATIPTYDKLLSLKSGSNTYYFNHMFAKEINKTSANRSTSQSFIWRTARHIANLSYADPGITAANHKKYLNTAAIKYSIECNIDFHNYDFTNTVSQSQANKWAGLGSFAATINGNEKTIYLSSINLSNYRFAGLINTASSAKINDLTISGKNPLSSSQAPSSITTIMGSIEGNNEPRVGALVGAAQGATVISNCHVEDFNFDVKTTNSKNTTKVGGLVGIVEGTSKITGSSSNRVTITSTSAHADSNAGGLVGHLSAGTIENSSARNAKITANKNNVGGFVGAATSGTITNCFASGSEISGTSYVGGFVGNNAATISKSMSNHAVFYKNANGSDDGWGKITATGSNVGGFVGGTTGTISSCYTLAKFENDNANIGAFAGSGGSSVITKSYAITQNKDSGYISNFTKSGTAGGTTVAFNGGNETNIKAFSTVEGFAAVTAANTYPNASTLTGEAYPYPSSIKNGTTPIHYADWPDVVEPVEAELVYYERYADGTYGTHKNVSVSSVITEYSTLNNEKTVVRDGYGFLVPAEEGAAFEQGKYIFGYGGGTENSFTTKESLTIDGDLYYIYNVPLEGTGVVVNRFDPLTTIQLRGINKEYKYCPSFARNAVNGAHGGLYPSSYYYIRTARQLADIQRYTNYWDQGNAVFKQDRDIDFSTHEATKSNLVRNPIGNASTAFNTSYDGSGYIITGMSVEGSGNVGLFGRANGWAAEIRNVIFLADSNNGAGRTISGSGNVGALVGSNGGRVINCVAAGFNVTGSGNVGGFVGSNTGNISYSMANNAVFYKKADASNDGWGSVSPTATNIGGFAGQATSNLIEHSYALAKFTSPNGNIGAFCGKASGWEPVKNCYAIAQNPDGSYITNAFKSGSGNNVIAFNGTNKNAIATAMKNASSSGWGNPTEENTFPHAEILEDDAYPFVSSVKKGSSFVHYGDWPFIMYEGMYYFERYSNNTYGIYSEIDGEIINTLNNKLTVLEDGYAILVSGDKTVSVDSTVLTKRTGPGLPIENIGADFNLYPMNVSDSVAFSSFYKRVTVNIGGVSKTAYYNPSFAKTVVYAGSTPSKPSNILIRTARHFAALQSQNTYWVNTASFYQERDLNFATHSATSSNQTRSPIGNSSVNFNGSYNGGGNVITGFSIYDSRASALFGVVGSTGRLNNVVFIGDGNKRTISAEKSQLDWIWIGGIAARNYGTINNCATAGLLLEAYAGKQGSLFDNNRGKSNVGGFVGENHAGATITNCSSSHGQYRINDDMQQGIFAQAYGKEIHSVERNNRVGGFVGNNQGTINNSYALARLQREAFTITASRENKFAVGSFAGAVEGSGDINNCYGVAIDQLTGIKNQNSGDKWSADSYISFINKEDSSSATNAIRNKNVARKGNSATGNELSAEALINRSFGSSFGYVGFSSTFDYEGRTDKGEKYPFPAVVKNDSGSYVHYGNWPVDAVSLGITAAAIYYENYEDGSFGYNFSYKEGSADKVLDTLKNDSPIIDAGYGYIILQSQVEDANGIMKSLKFKINGGNETTVAPEIFGDTVYAFYKFQTSSPIMSAASNTSLSSCYATLSVSGANSAQANTFFNPSFARAIGTAANSPNISEFEIRTQWQEDQKAKLIAETNPNSAFWLAKTYKYSGIFASSFALSMDDLENGNLANGEDGEPLDENVIEPPLDAIVPPKHDEENDELSFKELLNELLRRKGAN